MADEFEFYSVLFWYLAVNLQLTSHHSRRSIEVLIQTFPLFVEMTHEFYLLNTQNSPAQKQQWHCKQRHTLTISNEKTQNNNRFYLLVTMMLVFLCPGYWQWSLNTSPSSCLISDRWKHKQTPRFYLLTTCGLNLNIIHEHQVILSFSKTTGCVCTDAPRGGFYHLV